MKIICRTNNGAIMVKPETSLTRIDWPFFVPDWSNDVIAEVGVAARINHLGKSIPQRFANRYFDQVTIGVNFCTRDLYEELISDHQAADIATGFDGSCYLGEWMSLTEVPESEKVHGQNWQDIVEELESLIADASKYYLLKTGDIVMTAPLNVIENIKENDIISEFLGGKEVTHCRCK